MSENVAFSHRTLVRAGALAAFAAAIANLALFAAARGIFGLELEVAVAPDSELLAPLAAIKIITASVVPALVATALLALIARFVARPMRVFVPLAVVVLVLSMAGPTSIPVDGPGTTLVLGLMHVVAAVATVGVLAWMTRSKP